MNPQPLLAKIAERYLKEQCSFVEVVDCAAATRETSQQQQSSMEQRLAQEPTQVLQLCQPEKVAWEESTADFLHWTEIALNCQGDQEALEMLRDGLPVSAQRLQLDRFRLEEALWISRGPSTLSWLNRLLAALAEGDRFEEYYQQELALLHDTAEACIESYPEALREWVGGCLDALLSWLEALPSKPSQWADWADQGRELGREFASLDYHYLWRGYSGGPSPYRSLNVAINACWLQEQQLVAGELSQVCLQEALVQLDQLKPPPNSELWELYRELVQVLQQMLKLSQQDRTTAALRQTATEVALDLQQLLEAQSDPKCGPSDQGQATFDTATPAGRDRLEHLLEMAWVWAEEKRGEQELRQALADYRADLNRAQAYQEPAYLEILRDFSAGLSKLEKLLEAPQLAGIESVAEQLREAELRLQQWREEALTKID